jgi:hypothetical protein
MCGMDICEIVYVISVGHDFVSLEKGKGNLYHFYEKIWKEMGRFLWGSDECEYCQIIPRLGFWE